MKRVLFVLNLLFLLSLPFTAAAGSLFKLELTNKSGLPLDEIIMTPTKPPGQAHTVKTAIAPDAKTVITRPEGDLLRMVFKHASGSFSFADVSFFQEKDTRARLQMVKPNVPELVFFDGKDIRMAKSGENSTWGFASVIGSFPYGVGVTTMAQAKAYGATAGAKKDEMKAQQVWEGHKWSLDLRFAGDTPNSSLRSLTMRFKNSAQDKVDMVLHDALATCGYIPFRSKLDQNVVQHYELIAQGKDVEEALGALFAKKTPQSNTVFYGPKAFVDALVATAQKNGSAQEVFAQNANAVIAAYTHTMKDDMESVVMARAGDLAGNER